MLTEQQARDICDQAIAACEADGIEVWVGEGDSALTRFAENRIHQNVAESGQFAQARVRVGHRLGGASTNDLSDEGLRRMVAAATEAARLTQPDEELLPLIGPQEYRPTDAFRPDTTFQAHTAQDRAAAVGQAVEAAKANGLRVAGSFSQSAGARAMASSAGVFAYHASTRADFSITAQAEDSTGWGSGQGRSVSDLDVPDIAQTAVRGAARARAPRDIEPARYNTILQPAAVADMLWFLPSHFSALAVDEGRSCLQDRLGERIASELVTIRSDPWHPLHQGTPFDAEGLPRRPLTLIDRGVARDLAYDRLTAQKHGTEPTGHGQGGSNTTGAHPTDIVLEGGTTSVEEMIQQVDRGLLVTRLWYLRTVDPLKVLVTGMTRDGLFLVENGEIQGPVKNLRFNESTLAVLENVVAMSEPVLVEGMVAPALLVEGFNFTSATEF
ncbi:MAG: TldD/PmbA family protein [Armatimonadota bacterium]